jgi:hypothetical protein
MARGSTSKPSRSKKQTPRTKAAKKRVRRVIFTADQWYASAALSIGIAGRAKSARPMQLFTRVEEREPAE